MTIRLGRCLLANLLLIGSLAAPGCSNAPPPPKTVPVSGKVTYKGAPLTKGLVSFIPDAGAPGPSRPTTAPIQGDGAYKATTFQEGDGLIPGKYKIVVTSEAQSVSVEDLAAGKKPVSSVPQKYTAVVSTPLTLEVKDEGKPVMKDLELVD